MTEVVQPTLQVDGDKKQEALRIATEMYGKAPDWVTFFREVVGVGGVARRLFTNADELTDFEQSSEYRDIQQMVAKLREKGGDQDQDKEPTRVITVRLPKSLHESLRVEAHDRHTSMNQLCISKLLQFIEDSMVPSDSKTDGRSAESAPVNRLNLQAATA